MREARIGFVFGTRPEAIKLAPLILELSRRPNVRCHVCVTGQHREMLDQVLQTFAIRPDSDLAIMTPDQDLPTLSAALLTRLDAVLASARLDLVLVQGDTTSTFCAALAAFYHRIPIGHVEAGLRTGNLHAPWPEEANRALTSRLAAIHFAPTEQNRQNLLAEGVPADSVHVTGNTVVDALRLMAGRIRNQTPGLPPIPERAQLDRIPEPIVLITAHRREHFGAGLDAICRAVRLLAQRFPEVQFVYPVHLNPKVQGPVAELLGTCGPPNIHLLAPLSYLAFVQLLQRCILVLTDSGGIQEEAPSLGKPVLVLRDATERPEAIAAGTARLVGTDVALICAETTRLLTDPAARQAMSRAPNPYGDGRAAVRIADLCCRLCGCSE